MSSQEIGDTLRAPIAAPSHPDGPFWNSLGGHLQKGGTLHLTGCNVGKGLAPQIGMQQIADKFGVFVEACDGTVGVPTKGARLLKGLPGHINKGPLYRTIPGRQYPIKVLPRYPGIK